MLQLTSTENDNQGYSGYQNPERLFSSSTMNILNVINPNLTVLSSNKTEYDYLKKFETCHTNHNKYDYHNSKYYNDRSYNHNRFNKSNNSNVLTNCNNP